MHYIIVTLPCVTSVYIPFLFSVFPDIIQFNMRDESVSEGDGSCDVTIQKMGTTQEDVTVRLRTLTIEQYEAISGNTIYDINPAESKPNLPFSKTITK